MIETDTARIVPDAGVLFAVALYLLMERHRPVIRDEIEQLVWPTTDARKRGHCLRQAVYRLKSLGFATAPANGDRTHISIDGPTDVDALTIGAVRAADAVELPTETLIGGFLPGYAPGFSDRFTEWLERRRDVANSAARRVLIAAIATKRSQHEWGEVETLAKACLSIDPLNEEATLSLAEAAAMHGSKSFALTVLDRYLKEIGPDAREIRLPATLLKRRISESRPTERPLHVGQTPFVGREAEFAALNQTLEAAIGGEGSSHLVWGEPGIGKTRLAMEFSKAAELHGVRVVKTKCQSHDQTRTMSIFVDMVPQLLRIPGALGCAPETMNHLRRLTDHRLPDRNIADSFNPEFRVARLRSAIADLLDAVSVEEPLLIVADDVQWADAASLSLVAEMARWVLTRRILLVLTARDEIQSGDAAKRWLASFRQYHLRPLPISLAEQVLSALECSSGQALGEKRRRWCIDSSGGNPFFLVELFLGNHKDDRESLIPTSISAVVAERIAAVSPTSHRLLQACAVLETFATLDRIEALLAVSRTELLDALDETDALGLITRKHNTLGIVHDLVLQAIRQQTTTASGELLHRRAAELFETESGTCDSVTHLWQCASHWKHAGATGKWISALEDASSHAYSLGYVREAMNTLHEAIECAPDADTKARLANALMRWGVSAREFEKTLEIGKLLERLGHSPVLSHSEQELAYYRAVCMVEGRTRETVDSLLRCVRDPAASSEHRLSAAIMIAKIADTEMEAAAAAHEAFAVASEIWGKRAARPKEWFLLQLIFNTSFGDTTSGSAAAAEYLKQVRRTENVPELIGALTNASFAMNCAGQTGGASALAVEAFQLAERYRLVTHLHATSVWLVDICIADNDLDGAAYWSERAQKHDGSLSTDFTQIALRLSEVRIASRRDDIAKARQLLQALRNSFPELPVVYRAIESALSVMVRLSAGEACALSAEADDVLNHFDRLKRRRDSDILCASVFRIYAARNELQLAVQVVVDYLRQFRRNRSALDPELADVVNELGGCASAIPSISRPDVSPLQEAQMLWSSIWKSPMTPA